MMLTTTVTEPTGQTIGYVCKQCGTVSPTGIGYTVTGPNGSDGVDSCECGFSRRTE